MSSVCVRMLCIEVGSVCEDDECRSEQRVRMMRIEERYV
jgi:hypothetical protein